MRVPFTNSYLPLGKFTALAKHLPFRVTVPILHGPARGMKWILGSTEPNYWLRPYEQKKVERLLTYLNPKSVFYDIGANVGYYSLVAASKCQNIFAFEPLPTNFDYLTRHIAINQLQNCTPIKAAVTGHDGMVSFSEGNSTCEGSIRETGTLLVCAVKLDTFIERALAPDIVKIDVEGAELDALHGAKQLLAERHPVIFLATHSNELNRQCREFLLQCGYQVENLENRELIATP
jgi:FkbM family methyltransferase